MGAAPVELVPLVHVARLLAWGRFLLATGSGSGFAGFGSILCCGTAGALSLAMSDLRNHEGLEVIVGVSVVSFERKLRSECFRPRSREEDLGRRGSTASEKKSWSIACLEVGRCLGSHIKHQVTKLLKLAGHWGGGRMVSIAWGAICHESAYDIRVSSVCQIPLGTRSPISGQAWFHLSIHHRPHESQIWYTSSLDFPLFRILSKPDPLRCLRGIMVLG